MNTARRLFLHRATALAAATGAGAQQLQLGLQLGGLSSLAALAASAHAADTRGYKALVCLYMHGGNDGHNWLVPTDATGYADYVRARGALALPAATLQSITATTQGAGRTFGVPAELAPIRSLYEAGRAAFVANVGPLLRPITKADYLAGRGVPPRLFSHNDQQSTWQSLAPEGARSGWGGRMGDVFAAANANPVFTAVSATGNAVFLTGTGVVQYQVNTDGPVGVNPLNRTWLLGSAAAPGALRTLLADAGSNPFHNEYTRITQRALQAEATLRSALTSVSVPALPAAPMSLPTGNTTLDQDALARQLRMVARLAAAQQALGMRRQVFMVSLGGFDTHNNQLSDQAALTTRIATSVRWFHDTLTTLGLADSVTLFTASDFGRTLASNGDGSDHGWGNHHLVVGPALRGREVHGRMPVTAIGTADDVGSGRLLPSTSVSQLAASLGRWMGLTEAELAWVLPDLPLFSAAPANAV
jgi:uncharacterized protein (DUF1501 family)